LWQERKNIQLLNEIVISDHAVLIRKGGYPVALNHQAEEGKALRIESMPTPIDSQM
jgi:hypothetical protein